MAIYGTVSPGYPTSFKNRIHNGSFNVWQRSTPITGVGVDGRATDRWFQWAAAGGQSGRTTWSQETSDLPTGFTTGLNISVTTTQASPSSGEAYAANIRTEGQDFQDLAWGTSSAKSITVSFWAKTNKTGTYCVYLNHSSASTKYNIREVSLTNTWTYYTLTFSGDTSQVITNDTQGRLALYIGLMAGSGLKTGTAGDAWNTGYGFTTNQVNFFDSTSNVMRITGVQMEAGPVATPFEFRPYAVELALCQRYYAPFDSFRKGGCVSTDSSGRYIEKFVMPVTMRGSPTLTWTRTGARGADGFSAVPSGSTTISTSVGTKYGTQLENSPNFVTVLFYGSGANLVGAIHYYDQDSTAYASSEI